MLLVASEDRAVAVLTKPLINSGLPLNSRGWIQMQLPHDNSASEIAVYFSKFYHLFNVRTEFSVVADVKEKWEFSIAQFRDHLTENGLWPDILTREDAEQFLEKFGYYVCIGEKWGEAFVDPNNINNGMRN